MYKQKICVTNVSTGRFCEGFDLIMIADEAIVRQDSFGLINNSHPGLYVAL
jgi:hypothetical protein